MTRLFPSALAAVGFFLSLGMTAHAQFFNAVGASGDRSDQNRCPAGSYLVGFGVYSGLWIDGLVIKCSQFTRVGSGGTLGPPMSVGSERGGKAGMTAPNQFVCPANMYITGIGFWTTGNGQVQHVGAKCGNLERTADGEIEFGGPRKGAATTQLCDGTNKATGVNINSGKHINALGLICDRSPGRIVNVGKPRPGTPAFCSAYADRQLARLAEGKQLKCNFATSGNWPDDRTKLESSCTRFSADVISTNETTLGSDLEACKKRLSGPPGDKIATVMNPTTLYLSNGSECYMSPNDKGTVSKQEGGFIFITATSGACRGKSGKVWPGDQRPPADVVIGG